MLPRLILIANRFTDGKVAARVIEAIQAGVRWVHLRDRQVSDINFRASAVALVEAIRATSSKVVISVNGRLDIADELGLHYHTGLGNLLAVGRKGLRTGYSAHTIQEATQLVEGGVNYLFYSPVFPTTSKPGHKGIGLDQLKMFCETAAPVPVYALGGITPERCAACLEAGAYGVAVVSGILEARSVREAVDGYQQGLHINRTE